MTKDDNEDLWNSTSCWICDNDFVDTDVKVKDHCHITGNNRGTAHRDYNIILKLNHKVLALFNSLKN